MAARSGDLAGKQQRKQNRKLLRIQNHLTKNESIILCEEPTKILCVQNGGLDNGVSQDDLHELFTRYGCLQDIIMIPRKAYCFVCYDTAEAAAAAKEILTGHLLREGKDPSQNINLYVFFVASAPPSVCSSTHLPSGLLLLENFITMETEQLLLKSINFEDSSSSGTGSSLKHRAVKHYGYEFKYGINNVDPKEPLPEGIPQQCQELLQRAVDSKVVSHFPDQLTVNRYLPGQGIPPHVDTPSAFEDGIMSLSCGSQVIMDFRHPEGTHLSVLVPPRSLLVMTGDSRYVWSHGITPRKSDIIPSATGGLTLATRGVRTSFTFRKLSATAGMDLGEQKDRLSCMPTTDQEASALESHHVHSVYEEIAEHFSDTRHTPWPQIAEFVQGQEPGSILVDIGCGNGKYFGVNSRLCQIGSDRSENLAHICGSRGFQVFVGDVLAIPVRSGSVDVCMCIAVIHHLSTKARRKQAIEELVRILRPAGCVLIYVWAQEQLKDNKKSKYLKTQRQYKQESKAFRNQQQGHGADVKTEVDNETAHFSEDSSLQNVISCDSQKDSNAGDERSQEKSGRTCLTESRKEQQEEASESVQAGGDTNPAESPVQGNEVDSSDSPKTQNSNEVLQVHVNRTEFKKQDLLVPWQLKNARAKENQAPGEGIQAGKQFHRYYHVFVQGELEELCAEVSGCVVKRSYYDQGNWCVLLEKC